jgi:hypothetical protein
MRLIPKRLAPRLILALTLPVAIATGVFAIVNLHTQERQLLDELVTGTNRLPRSIASAARRGCRAMLGEAIAAAQNADGGPPPEEPS